MTSLHLEGLCRDSSLGNPWKNGPSGRGFTSSRAGLVARIRAIFPLVLTVPLSDFVTQNESFFDSTPIDGDDLNRIRDPL